MCILTCVLMYTPLCPDLVRSHLSDCRWLNAEFDTILSVIIIILLWLISCGRRPDLVLGCLRVTRRCTYNAMVEDKVICVR